MQRRNAYKPLFPKELTDRIFRPAGTLPPSAPPALPVRTLPAVPGVAVGSPRGAMGGGALPPTAPAVPVYAASGQCNVLPDNLYDVERVRSAVRAYVGGDASPEDTTLLLGSNSARQSMAHFAATNGQSDVIAALAEPLADAGVPDGRKEALRDVLVRTDTAGRNSPVHLAGLYGRADMLRIYADPQLGMQGALLVSDAYGNNAAHYWGMGGRDVSDLGRLADGMGLEPAHPLREALTQRNRAGLMPEQMGAHRQGLPSLGAGAGGAAAGAGPSL